MEAEGRYPRRRQITERIVGWDSTEVQAWVNERLKQRIELETLKEEYRIEQEALRPVIEFMQANDIETLGEALRMMDKEPEA